MVYQSLRAVDPFDRCYRDDRRRRSGVDAAPFAGPVVHGDGLVFQVDLDAADRGPPVGDEPPAVSWRGG